MPPEVLRNPIEDEIYGYTCKKKTQTRRFITAWRKPEDDAARHRQVKREATDTRKVGAVEEKVEPSKQHQTSSALGGGGRGVRCQFFFLLFFVCSADHLPFLASNRLSVVALLHTVLRSCTLLPEQTQFAILGPPSNPKLFPQPSRACSTLSLRLLCLPRPKNSLCRRLAALHLPLGWMISSCHLP